MGKGEPPEIAAMSKDTTPPKATRNLVTHSAHGESWDDPYAWLRDDNWQEVMRAPDKLRQDVRDYLEAENAYLEATMAPTEALRETLFGEMKGRIKEDDSSVPANDGDWAYYRRYREGGQHPLYCRRPRDGKGDGEEESLLLDGDALSKGTSYFQIASVSHTYDHRHLAYAVDDKGSEYCEIRFLDLESGDLLPERLKDNNGAMAWAKDGRTLFYVVQDENHRPCKLYRHRLGSDPAEDVLVYEETDPGFFLGVGVCESRQFVVVHTHDHTTSECYLIDADQPESAPRLVAPRLRDQEYYVFHDAPRDRLLILTNADGAEDFKICEAPLDGLDRENWRELVPHRPGCLRLDLMLLRDHFVRLERVEGLPRIVVTRFSDEAAHEIAFEEAAYSLGLLPGFEYDSRNLRFVYSSMTTPERTYDYDLESRERVLRKQQEVPSGHDPDDYVSERILAPSHDGAEVPVSILRRKETPLDGSAPLLLYGYGSYGITIPAAFSTNRLSLVDRGFVYAIAHLRGGKAKGYAWYRDGKLLKKKNTFLDFIAAAEHLAAEGYSRRGEIAIHGGSAGGMLVGAALNMAAPDLFKAAVAEVPFVDVLNTMCDKDLPLTPPEWPEWGNPLESREAFDYIRSYSPYDNLEPRPYPHILATGGLTDPRVTYWEPAKWVARLRETQDGDRMLLLKTYMEAGHGGSAGRFERLQEVALVYAFLLLAFGKV